MNKWQIPAMKKVWKPGDPVPNIHDDVPGLLKADGFCADAVSALLDFDTANFQHYRMVVKGEVVSAVIDAFDMDLELTEFHTLTAILRIRAGVGRPAGEATIGLVAEELAVDPSRASRLVSDLVAKGLIRREAAQDDGRKSVLTPTDEGMRILKIFKQEKWNLLARVFKDWKAEDIAAYARSVRAYSEGMQAAIAELRAKRTK